MSQQVAWLEDVVFPSRRQTSFGAGGNEGGSPPSENRPKLQREVFEIVLRRGLLMVAAISVAETVE